MKKNTTLFPLFVKMTNQIMSFYIPRMRTFWTQDQIAALLYHSVGVVDRVDYGDYSPANQTYTGYVFVHFIEIPEVNREWINNELCSYGHCRIQIAFDEFWMLIPNKNPIPTTHLNIHQLADIVNKQNDRISTLETMVHYLQTQIESRIPSHSIFMTDTNSLQDVGQNFSPTSVSQSDDDNDYTGMPALIPVYVTPDSSVVNV